ncbi:MAG: cellulose synthase complex periplasmic endoglucanase BcsZ [Sulfuricella sp.]
MPTTAACPVWDMWAYPSPRRYSALLLVMLLWGTALTACAASAFPPWATLWSSYQQHFIDGQGRVIDPQDDGASTSESQAYALFFALVANKPQAFARILQWTQNNMAQGDLARHLPAWHWGRNAQGHWGVLSADSASDADLWMAYTLLEAGRLWQTTPYTALGLQMAQMVARDELISVPNWGPILLPGPSTYWRENGRIITNPSYLPLFILLALGKVLPESPWPVMAEHLPDFMAAVAPRKLAPDWIAYRPGTGWEMAPEGPGGIHDAIRCYLWAGMTNAHSPGAQALLDALGGMATYLRTHDIPPLTVNTLSGTATGEAHIGFSSALLTYLRRLGEIHAYAQQSARLHKALDPRTQLHSQHYYDNNLTLFAIGRLDGTYSFTPEGALRVRWQTPTRFHCIAKPQP